MYGNRLASNIRVPKRRILHRPTIRALHHLYSLGKSSEQRGEVREASSTR